MLDLPGYTISNQIHEGTKTRVYRGYQDNDQTPIIVKIAKSEYPTLLDLAKLKHEYEIIKNFDLEGVVRPYGLEQYNKGLALILEDKGGASLKEIYAKKELELKHFLRLAIQITEILGNLHQHHVIHKDIKPHNILYHPDSGKIQLIDFGIAVLFSKENQQIRNPELLEGSIAYISPEQTGRMNRALDYRTDLYSLGVTFYEMLTEQLPFPSKDPLELIHCHIAKQPLPPHEINAEIPQALSRIVMKLLSKTAEERYQGTYGLRSDLEQCLEQWETTGIIHDFALGIDDVSDQFQIPEKLYGREEEVRALMATFERVSQGHIEMMLVAGYSGIGKSVLIQEIHKPVIQQQGYFVSGKFDQFQRNVPYSALIQAFQELVQQLLTESETQLDLWKKNLLKALVPNGQVIVEVIPEIEMIIGKQPAVPELLALESQNRFNLVFKNFVRVFAQKNHPLALFLDDLQWADLATLQLIETLIIDPETRYLYLIGAYRENEVSSSHPLMILLDTLEKGRVSVNHVVLTPLKLEDLQQLIVESLHCETQAAQPLAELVFQKTSGNPFFVKQFIKSLYTDGLLAFDTDQRHWQWDIEKLRELKTTDNVVDLMVRKMAQLAPETQQVLKLAACIGNPFDLRTLSIVQEKSLLESAKDLWLGVQEGFVLSNGTFRIAELEMDLEWRSTLTPSSHIPPNPHFRFLHDRVQQAAYSMIADDYKIEVHLKIGQLILNNCQQSEEDPQGAIDERIFDIVNQLNFGTSLIKDQTERDELARLNLNAGKKAKASAAYGPALDYLKAGIDLLGEDGWQRQYDLELELYVEAAEAAYLGTEIEQMEELSEVVLQSAQTLLDKVRVYEVKIQGYIAQNKTVNAVELAIKVLELLGVKFPKKPNKLHVVVDLMATKRVLAGKPITSLADLPNMTNLHHQASMRILAGVSAAVYMVTPELFPLIVFQMTKLSVKHGNSPVSSSAYFGYAIILSGALGDIQAGAQFAQVGLTMLERSITKETKAKAYLAYNLFIQPWMNHVQETLGPLLEGYQSGLEVGDLEYGVLCALVYCLHALMIGKELRWVEQEMATYSEALRRLKQERNLHILELYRHVGLNLMGKTENPCLMGENYQEYGMLALFVKTNDKNSLCWLYIFQAMLFYLFGDHTEALKNARLADKYLEAILGLMGVPFHYFYYSLILLALYPNASRIEQKRILKQVARHQKKMKKWAHHAPMNYLHKFYLVEAERARISGREQDAQTYYEQAIVLARKQEYLHEEALAHELVAQFYLSKGQLQEGQQHLRDAHHTYMRWGAIAKVKDLETKQPLFFDRAIPPSPRQLLTVSSTTQGESASSVLDLTSVLKASQTISGEIVLEELLKKMMQIVMENAGAQKGFFILHDKDQLRIEVEGVMEPEERIMSQSRLLEMEESSNLSPLPVSLIHYVARTQEAVVLNHASHDSRFTTDPYITSHQPKSILCNPILHQGKLIGILYLENNLTTGAFTPNRLEILELLTTQAAISIDNARLYGHLEEKVTERTKEVTEKINQLGKVNQELEDEIAKRRWAEQELRVSQRRLARILDMAEDAIISVDETQQITFFNQGAERTFGYTTQEMLGKSLNQLLLPQSTDLLHQQIVNITNASSSPSSETQQVIARHKDNREFAAEISVSKLALEEETGYAVIFHEANQSHTQTSLLPSRSKTALVNQLKQNQEKVKILERAMDNVVQFMVRGGNTMVDELRKMDNAFEGMVDSLSEEHPEAELRETLVLVMALSLSYWETTTETTKIELAEESQIWRVYLDKGVYQTRTLDKYLNLETLPKRPRWNDVIRTANHVLTHCPPTSPLKIELESALSKLKELLQITRLQ